jgi:hypothetical protein
VPWLPFVCGASPPSQTPIEQLFDSCLCNIAVAPLCVTVMMATRCEDDSSKVIDSTMDEHQVLGNETKSATGVMQLMQRRNVRSGIKITAAALFYFVVVLYILKVRVLG